MDEYKFTPDESKLLVQAIIEGYSEYIKHRIEHFRSVKISSPFTLDKASFIESKIAEIGNQINLTYRKSKAGLNWNYLQFMFRDKKILFLVMNAAYFDESRFSQEPLPDHKRKGTPRTYLYELSKINAGLAFKEGKYTPERQTEAIEQLALFEEEQLAFYELDDEAKVFNEFHVITYKIDSAFEITEIMHYLPNPENNKAYFIEVLSHYISGAELTGEEREILASAEDTDPPDFESEMIEIFEEERK